MNKLITKNKLIIDTNFLFIPGYYKIDLIEEIKINFPDYEIIIPEAVIDELESLKKRGEKKKWGKFIKIAENLIEELKKMNCKIIKSEKKFDDYIINFLKNLKDLKNKESKEIELVGICTNDKNLKRKIRKILKKENLKNVFIVSSSGKRLVI